MTRFKFVWILALGLVLLAIGPAGAQQTGPATFRFMVVALGGEGWVRVQDGACQITSNGTARPTVLIRNGYVEFTLPRLGQSSLFLWSSQFSPFRFTIRFGSDGRPSVFDWRNQELTRGRASDGKYWFEFIAGISDFHRMGIMEPAQANAPILGLLEGAPQSPLTVSRSQTTYYSQHRIFIYGEPQGQEVRLQIRWTYPNRSTRNWTYPLPSYSIRQDGTVVDITDGPRYPGGHPRLDMVINYSAEFLRSLGAGTYFQTYFLLDPRGNRSNGRVERLEVSN